MRDIDVQNDRYNRRGATFCALSPLPYGFGRKIFRPYRFDYRLDEQFEF